MLAKKNVGNILLFPETDKKIYNEIESIPDYKPMIVRCTSMEEAVIKAFEVTSKDSLCLLSPGAPSYLMYNNLSERGDDFKQHVLKYGTTSEKKGTKESHIQQDTDSPKT